MFIKLTVRGTPIYIAKNNIGYIEEINLIRRKYMYEELKIRTLSITANTHIFVNGSIIDVDETIDEVFKMINDFDTADGIQK